MALLSALAVAIYGQTQSFGFVYDDFFQIVRNKVVTAPSENGLLLDQIFGYPTFPGDLYRPLSVLSYRMNFLMGGLEPAGYHLLNVVLHVLIAIQIWFLFSKDLKLSKYGGLFGAVFFLVLPVNVEAVVNVVGRAELLATLFCLSALRCCLSTTRSVQILGPVVFLLACCSKESALTFVGIAFLLMLGSGRERGKVAVLPLRNWAGVFLLPASLYLAARYLVLGPLFFQERDLVTFYVENPLLQEGFITRFWAGLVLLGRYVEAMLVPIQLSADYSATEEDFFLALSSVDGLRSLFVSLFVIVVGMLRWRSWYGFFLLWIPIALLSTLNILTPAGTLMGDRLAYLPSVGFTLLVGLVLSEFIERSFKTEKKLWVLEVMLVAVLVFTYSLLSFSRAAVWASNETLFSQTALDRPRSPKALVNYGLFLANEKNDPSAAIEYLRHAVALEPARGEYYRYFVSALLKAQRYKQAAFWLDRALVFYPGNAEMIRVREQLRDLGM